MQYTPFSRKSFLALIVSASSFSLLCTKTSGQIPLIKIITGSTREGRSSLKIASYIHQQLRSRKDVMIEILDLRDYHVPFLNDAVPPVSRTIITDLAVQKWSKTVAEADGFIFVVPEYNAGYPGVLKNALDSLYKEWGHKPVGFIGFSGGSSGGKNAVAQLHVVVKALQMDPVEKVIAIPAVWKAFDAQGGLVDPTFNAELNTMVEQILLQIQ